MVFAGLPSLRKSILPGVTENYGTEKSLQENTFTSFTFGQKRMCRAGVNAHTMLLASVLPQITQRGTYTASKQFAEIV